MIPLTLDSIRPVVRRANFFDPKEDTVWGPRTIPDFELIMIVRGALAYEDERGACVQVEEGTILCLHPGIEHTLSTLPGINTIACVHCELSRQGPWITGAYKMDFHPELVTSSGQTGILVELFRETARVYAGFSQLREQLLENLVRQICMMLGEQWLGCGEGGLSVRVQEMVSYLRRHISYPVTRTDLARVFSITPQHVNAIFKKELGMTPTQVHHREKIFMAVRLIQEEGTSIKILAEKLGFSNVSHFSRVFKKIMDVSPGKMR